jgi:AraC family transcriptional regulator, arabinose operon regulatory protein
MDDAVALMDNLPMKRSGPESFVGQHRVIVPPDVVQRARRHPLLSGLLPSAAGYYPHAAGHYASRSSGLPELIVIVCWSGRGWVQVGARRHVVMPHEVVFIPSGSAHAYGADDHDPWSIIWAHAVGRDVPHFLAELRISAHSPKLRLPANGIESLLFERVWQIAEEGYSIPQLLAAASALRFAFSEMLRLKLAPRAPEPRNDAVRRVTEWMHQHVDAQVKLTQLARQFGASVSRLSALFRERMGYAPMDYFSRLKIQRACFLLDTTSADVKEVSAQLGFSDPYYFSRAFKRVMGVSPRAYRAAPKG